MTVGPSNVRALCPTLLLLVAVLMCVGVAKAQSAETVARKAAPAAVTIEVVGVKQPATGTETPDEALSSTSTVTRKVPP